MSPLRVIPELYKFLVMDNIEIVRGFVRYVWAAGNAEAIGQYVEEDYCSVGLRSRTGRTGPDGVL